MSAAQTPRRVQLSRKKGWRMPENTVKVTRPGKWGNPFVVGEMWVRRKMEPGGGQKSCGPVYDAVEAVRLFRRFTAREVAYQERVEELRGKNLACWCRLCEAHTVGKPFNVDCPDCEPCHADVLLRLANE